MQFCISHQRGAKARQSLRFSRTQCITMCKIRGRLRPKRLDTHTCAFKGVFCAYAISIEFSFVGAFAILMIGVWWRLFGPRFEKNLSLGF